MIDFHQIDDLARRLTGLVPVDMRKAFPDEAREELRENFKSVLQSGLARLDLVTREEFDVQREVLLRTRARLVALERTLAHLEAGFDAGAAPRATSDPN